MVFPHSPEDLVKGEMCFMDQSIIEPQIAVLGLGNWGTALANHLANKGYPVLGWTIHPEVVESINSKNINPYCLSDLRLSQNLRATLDLGLASSRSTVVLAFPSAALSELIPTLSPAKDAILVSAIKGIEMNSLLTPLGFCERNLKRPCKLAVLSGPSFAKDVAAGLPCGVVAASKDRLTARKVAELFSNEYMKAYVSDDAIGVELGGILKNVIAVAAGICDGLQLGDSARVGLITRGLAEITRLAVALGARRETLAGLSGLGDLTMTATCDASRNRTVGLRLGRGESLDHIVETLGSVAEGVKTAPLVLQLARKHQVEMPITEEMNQILLGKASAQDALAKLISRPIKSEF